MAEAIEQRDSHIWRVLFGVAETAATAQDLPEFYRAMHEIVGELMDATNFFIALYDEERRLICFPYYVDELPDPLPARISGCRSGWATRAVPRATSCARVGHTCSGRTTTGGCRRAV